MRNFHMKPIDKHNWRTITSLEVHSEQEEFIENNAESIIESLFEKQFAWSCFGLYLDNQAVGFIMIGAYNGSEESVWLDRFMIDAAYQGKGLGTIFLNKILITIENHWSVAEVILSISPSNQTAKEFYLQNGFEDSHCKDLDYNEDIFNYRFKSKYK